MNLHPDILPPGALTPEHALRAWPHQLPLAALWSAPDPSPHSRWVILAIPTHSLIAHHPAHALQLLQQTFASPSTRPPAPVPFVGGWIALLAYDLAFALEPALTLRHYPADQRLPSHARDDRRWPLLVLQRCDTALLHDRREHRWWGLGPRAPELARSLADTHPPTPPPFHLQPAQPDPRARRRYLHAVELALELIHAGDLYQVNLAHRLTRRFRGCPRELFRRLIDTARPWYGGYIAFRHHGRHHALCSASPELLFALDPRSRLVTTRPMKGTRPGHTPPDELRASPKEHAELAMIVDLARNDLGRVCQPGSVRVHAPRDLERHDAGNVLQATATVTGRLRHDRSTLDLLHALFPAASVTGAPKIRAVQIIDRLETARRGPYCGALGFLSDCGSAAFNVAIRSAALSATPRPDGELRGRLDYAVGAGIVADSNPRDEWEETLVKARPFLHDLPAETPSV